MISQSITSAFRVAAAFSLVLFASVSDAQVCLGNPGNGGVAFRNSQRTLAKANGGTVSLTPGSSSFTFNGNMIDAGDDQSGFDASMRYALTFGNKLKICPTIRLGYERRKWEAVAGDVISNQAIGSGGLALGYDFPIGKDFAIAPYVSAEYMHYLTHFQVDIDNSEPTNSGVTNGRPEAGYGFIARYSRFFAGFAGIHPFASGAPASRQLFIGYAF